MGQVSYAQVAARPRVAPLQLTSTPRTTVPDSDGFVEVRRKNRTAMPAGGPLPTWDAGKMTLLVVLARGGEALPQDYNRRRRRRTEESGRPQRYLSHVQKGLHTWKP
ncbi:hypothetical protein M0804_014304 [Polistes exclamans]|nr:hypothetical protein M0804_014304 [Polistes exclamans]